MFLGIGNHNEKAQRRRDREASSATETQSRRSLQRMVRHQHGKYKLVIIGSDQRNRLWLCAGHRNLVECEPLHTVGNPSWHLLVALRHLLRNRAMMPRHYGWRSGGRWCLLAGE